MFGRYTMEGREFQEASIKKLFVHVMVKVLYNQSGSAEWGRGAFNREH